MLRRSFILASGLLAAFPFIGSAAPAVDQINVFTSGQDGYHTYRIPSIIKAANGDLLAFCEGRKSAGGDSGNIDLLQKRSTDGGLTWSNSQVVWDDGDNTCGNPCPVLDSSTGTLWLLLTHNIGSDHEREIAARKAKGTRTVWVTHSADNGKTWAKPSEITATTKDPSWTWYATGPGVGIQIKNGKFAGRLVIPCDHNYDDAAENKHLSGSHTIFSDDHGKSWKLGGVIRSKVNECQIVELTDIPGKLLMDMRSNHGLKLRAQATSTDGGITWSPIVHSQQLTEPVCQASILRHESGSLLFSNPNAVKRVNMTVRESTDEGKTWTELAVLNPGPSAYSCLISLNANEAACLYERGTKRPYDNITFARFKVGGAK